MACQVSLLGVPFWGGEVLKPKRDKGNRKKRIMEKGIGKADVKEEGKEIKGKKIEKGTKGKGHSTIHIYTSGLLSATNYKPL